MSHEEVFATITRPHELAFDPGPARALIAERARAGGEAANVISSEILSGHPFLGGRESAAFALRLARVAPGARILLTIREQLRIIPSVYMQYVSRGGTMSAAEFFADAPETGFAAFSPGHFRYHRLVLHYRALFGAENVLVTTQEALAKDAFALALRIGRFAGNPQAPDPALLAGGREAVSYPEWAVPLLRRANRFRAGPAGHPVLDLGAAGRLLYRGIGRLSRTRAAAALFGSARPVQALARARFAGQFAASNRALAATIGPETDLSGYEGI
jgi:hypothetical protein